MAGCSAVAFLCAAGAAQAQTAPLIAGSAFTTDDLTYTVSTCSIQLQGASATACTTANTANDELEAVVSGTGASFQLINTASAPILSVVTTAAGPNTADLTLVVNIAPSGASSKTTLSSISSAVTGTTSNASVVPLTNHVTDGLTWTAGGTAYGINATAGGGTASQSFGATNTLTVMYDIGIQTTTTTPGVTLRLTNVSSTYAPAPEPASIALVATGVAGLAGLRRRARTAALSKI